MKTQTKRGLLAKAGALLAVAALAFSASPAQAQTEVTDMLESSGVVITKLVQPADPGEAASGEIQEGLTGPIPDVTFEAYEVPLDEFTKGTNEWQEKIATTTLEQSQELVGPTPDIIRTGITDAAGTVTWVGETLTGSPSTTGALDWGLYLVRETATPAGVVPAADFLLAVPLTNPSTPTGWLDTIYVYPKSSQVDATMSVVNAADYSVGDTVTWTINADIPQIRNNADGAFLPTDFFAITDTFTNAELAPGAVAVMLGETPLKLSVVEGDAGHYTLNSVHNVDETTTVTIEFTEAGRAAMAAALPGTPKVTATIDTTVNSIGTWKNIATIHPSGGLDGETSFYTNDATVKYGQQPVSVKDSANASVSGAQFRVYLTKDGARTRVKSEYIAETNPDGYLTTTDSSVDGIFTTDTDGKVTLGGFRYNDFADNATAEPGQTYWFAQVEAESGQQLLAEPVSFTITDTTEEKEIILSANANGFTLPLTGGTGTTLLTILGLGILAIVLFVARSRRNAEA